MIVAASSKSLTVTKSRATTNPRYMARVEGSGVNNSVDNHSEQNNNRDTHTTALVLLNWNTCSLYLLVFGKG